jgi:hypothetical protein
MYSVGAAGDRIVGLARPAARPASNLSRPLLLLELSRLFCNHCYLFYQANILVNKTVSEDYMKKKRINCLFNVIKQTLHTGIKFGKR